MSEVEPLLLPLLPRHRSSQNSRFGLLFLGISIVCFVLQSELVQRVQGDYYKPWFLLYIAHGSYSLLLPSQLLLVPWLSRLSLSDYGEALASQAKTICPSLRILWGRVALLTVIFNAGAYFWYVSVTRIPMGDVTAIYNTSCFFTYLLSALLSQTFDWIKLVAVCASISGIFIITGPTHWTDSTVGYAMALASSLFVALYEILFSRFAVPTRPSAFFSLYITGLIGLFTLTGGLLMFPILHYSNIEPFEWPPMDQLPWIGLVSLLGIGFNACFMLVISFSGPLIASVGIILTIPITLLVDIYITSHPYGLNTFLGSLAILFGYLLLHVSI